MPANKFWMLWIGKCMEKRFECDNREWEAQNGFRREMRWKNVIVNHAQFYILFSTRLLLPTNARTRYLLKKIADKFPDRKFAMPEISFVASKMTFPQPSKFGFWLKSDCSQAIEILCCMATPVGKSNNPSKETLETDICWSNPITPIPPPHFAQQLWQPNSRKRRSANKIIFNCNR